MESNMYNKPRGVLAKARIEKETCLLKHELMPSKARIDAF
jgi:hypothetical protein